MWWIEEILNQNSSMYPRDHRTYAVKGTKEAVLFVSYLCKMNNAYEKIWKLTSMFYKGFRHIVKESTLLAYSADRFNVLETLCLKVDSTVNSFGSESSIEAALDSTKGRLIYNSITYCKSSWKYGPVEGWPKLLWLPHLYARCTACIMIPLLLEDKLAFRMVGLLFVRFFVFFQNTVRKNEEYRWEITLAALLMSTVLITGIMSTVNLFVSLHMQLESWYRPPSKRRT